MAMRICRSFRNKVSLPTKTFPIAARSCQSAAGGVQPGVAGGIQPDFYGGAFGGTALVAWLFYRFDFRGCRTWFEDCMEEVRRLDFEDAKDGLEAIEREIEAMKAKQSVKPSG